LSRFARKTPKNHLLPTGGRDVPSFKKPSGDKKLRTKIAVIPGFTRQIHEKKSKIQFFVPIFSSPLPIPRHKAMLKRGRDFSPGG
jgi:hypothetical protein